MFEKYGDSERSLFFPRARAPALTTSTGCVSGGASEVIVHSTKPPVALWLRNRLPSTNTVRGDSGFYIDRKRKMLSNAAERVTWRPPVLADLEAAEVQRVGDHFGPRTLHELRT